MNTLTDNKCEGCCYDMALFNYCYKRDEYFQQRCEFYKIIKEERMIKTKIDATDFLNNREEWEDYYGDKSFHFVTEQGNNVFITRILYNEDTGWFIYHYGLRNRGETWSDQKATPMRFDEMIELVWKYRKDINKELKRLKEGI